jgi:hypothetical protein
MSAYYVDMIAVNSKREEIRTTPVRVLVDTGSELSWMPAAVLQAAGIQARRIERREYRLLSGPVNATSAAPVNQADC